MKFFVPLLLILAILPVSARPPNTQFNSGKKCSSADRTITWGPRQHNPKDEFRFRTGDRYLGHAIWEHYLGFEQFRTSSKAIKLSMIRLGDEDVREEVVLRPGFRYAIFKNTNGAMTVHIGVWSWTARVSALLLYDFGKQDAIIKAQRRHGKWQFSSTGAAFASQLQACAFTICKKRETVISPAENSPPKLNH